DRAAVAAERDRIAEEKIRHRVRGFEIGLLRPGASGAGEHVRRARALRRVVLLIAVDTGGGAVFADGADHQPVAVAAQADRVAELVAVLDLARIRRLDVSLLRPGGAGAAKQVHGPRVGP